MESNKLFAQTKPSRLFFKVAMPGMLSMLAMSVYSVIEGAFVGKYLGTSAFAAINLAMPFVMINFSLADLIGVGSSVPISVSLGKKDLKAANNYFSCSLILIFLAAVLMGILLFFTAPVFIGLMGAEGEFAELAVKYIRTYALCGPVTTLVFAMDNYLRICGFVRYSMVLNIFMSCLTIALVFLFIGVLGMNVEGSAFATCISMSVCALIAMIPFLRGKTLLKFVRPRFTGAMLCKIAACGTPTFLSNIAGRLASIVMNSALLRLGGELAVAAYSVLMYASDIVRPLLYGMSDSVQPAIGYNWGARSLKRVRDIAKCSFTACAVVSVIGTAVMFLFPEFICSVFIKEAEPHLLTLSVRAMKLFCTAFVFQWFGFAVQGFYSAVEKPLPASLLSVTSAMLFPIIFVYALMPLGLDGLWLNFTATSICVSLMALVMIIITQKRLKGDFQASK